MQGRLTFTDTTFRRSARVWVVDTREQAAPGGNTSPYCGWEAGSEDGPRFWLHCTIGGVAALPLDCRTTVRVAV